jgi:hypothetical protein
MYSPHEEFNMVLKLAALFAIVATTSQIPAIAATTHKQVGQNGTAYIYDDGSNKGYLCGLVQQNGTAFDVFLPALWPAAAAQTAGTAKSTSMVAVPWLHYANQADALDAINAYCPVTGSAPAPILS